MPKSVLLDLMAAKNPDYVVTEVVNVIPFRTEADMIGRTAGRLYFRGQNTIHAVTMSDTAMRELRDQITKALRRKENAEFY
jgi:hypothetical protein